MRFILFIFVLHFPLSAASQTEVVSGNYDALTIAFDSDTKLVTGYYENATGWDEETKSPRFSCTFYLSGTLTEEKTKITSLSPKFPGEKSISGTLEVLKNKKVIIQLEEDHGGCWNVQHFADKPAEFTLEAEKPWKQIRFVNTEKTFFYSDASENTKQTTYLLKGDIVFVENLKVEWAYCTFVSKTTTKGWLKISDLNNL